MLLRSNKIYFKARNITRDRKGNFTIAKGLITWKNIIIINLYAESYQKIPKIHEATSSRVERKHRKLKIVGNFDTSFSKIDRVTRQKSARM